LGLSDLIGVFEQAFFLSVVIGGFRPAAFANSYASMLLLASTIIHSSSGGESAANSINPFFIVTDLVDSNHEKVDGNFFVCHTQIETKIPTQKKDYGQK